MEGEGLGTEGGGIELGHERGSSERGSWRVDRGRWRSRRPGEGRLSGGHPSRGSEENKKPRLRCGVRGPGTVSVVPRPSVQDARDLRPHPPHGGAASAYTCSRRRRCESRSADGAATVVDTSTVAPEPQPATGGSALPVPRYARRVTAIPATFRAYVAEKVEGADGAPASCAASATFAAADLPAGRGRRSGSSGRASTSRTASRREPTARSPGSARSSRASTWPATVVASDDPTIAVGRRGPRPRLRPRRVPPRRLQRVRSGCRPTGSCRWRPD